MKSTGGGRTAAAVEFCESHIVLARWSLQLPRILKINDFNLVLDRFLLARQYSTMTWKKAARAPSDLRDLTRHAPEVRGPPWACRSRPVSRDCST
jgi:hypothetical protein